MSIDKFGRSAHRRREKIIVREDFPRDHNNNFLIPNVQLKGVREPTEPEDAANKAYVDKNVQKHVAQHDHNINSLISEYVDTSIKSYDSLIKNYINEQKTQIIKQQEKEMDAKLQKLEDDREYLTDAENIALKSEFEKEIREIRKNFKAVAYYTIFSHPKQDNKNTPYKLSLGLDYFEIPLEGTITSIQAAPANVRIKVRDTPFVNGVSVAKGDKLTFHPASSGQKQPLYAVVELVYKVASVT